MFEYVFEGLAIALVATIALYPVPLILSGILQRAVPVRYLFFISFLAWAVFSQSPDERAQQKIERQISREKFEEETRRKEQRVHRFMAENEGRLTSILDRYVNAHVYLSASDDPPFNLCRSVDLPVEVLVFLDEVEEVFFGTSYKLSLQYLNPIVDYGSCGEMVVH